MIVIVDYGLGNVRAFQTLYRKIDIPCDIARSGDELSRASKIILPGVGSFDFAMKSLQRSGMREQLDELVLHRDIPVLGVCVGMQMMSTSSEEGESPGLGWIPGAVKKFNFSDSDGPISVPHMGWNSMRPVTRSTLFSELDELSRFYFLHSYYFCCEQPESVLAVTDYGQEFACAVARENIFGVQFHPEKSHRWGTRLLQNFAEM